jgi:hypothetical protein
MERMSAMHKTEEFCSRCGAKTRGRRVGPTERPADVLERPWLARAAKPAGPELHIVVPLVPPSVNMYVRHTRAGLLRGAGR